MARIFRALKSAARRFFAVTGIPVPRAVRRLRKRFRRREAAQPVVDLRAEVEAIRRSVERLEAQAYIDRLGSREE